MMHSHIVLLSSTWRASPLRHAHETFSSSTHTHPNWPYKLLSSLYTRAAFYPWHTGCGRSTCYAVTMVTRNSICLFDGSYACTRHIVEFFLSRFFFFFFLSIYFVCVCVCIFHSFNCKCIVLLIFLVILRFLWDFRTGIDVIVLFSRNEGDIKDTLLIERV